MTCLYSKHGEFDLVGELYYQLRIANIEAHLELRIPSYLHRSRHMRVDIGIIKDGKLLAVIECKRQGKHMSKNCRQAMAYREICGLYGLESFFINDYEKISDIVADCLRLSSQCRPE